MGGIGETLGVRVKLSRLTRPKISPGPALANRTSLVRARSSVLRSDSPRTRWSRGRMGAGFLTCLSPRHCRRMKRSFFPKRERTPTLPGRESSGDPGLAPEELSPMSQYDEPALSVPTVGTRRPRTRQESPKCNSRAGFLWLRGSTVRAS